MLVDYCILTKCFIESDKNYHPLDSKILEYTFTDNYMHSNIKIYVNSGYFAARDSSYLPFHGDRHKNRGYTSVGLMQESKAQIRIILK
jgi:hypothetical protein